MAVCSGCSSVGACNCTLTVMDTASLDLTLTGTGAAGDPWVLSGVAAGGGGGTCQQKSAYTVGTIGPQGFGFDLGTQEPFLSCLDFVGDGSNDHVAVQAAIDAALYVAGGFFPLSNYVIAMPGFYVFSASVDTKGVAVEGSQSGNTAGPYVTWTNNAAIGGPGGTRIIDNVFTASGPGSLRLKNINIQGSGAAAIRQVHPGAGGAESMLLEDCIVTGTEAADAGNVLTDNIGSVVIRNCNITAGLNAIRCDSSISSTTLRVENCDLGSNTFAIKKTGSSVGTIMIRGNRINGNIELDGNIDELILTDNYIQGTAVASQAIHITSIDDFLIANNIILANTSGIVVDGSPSPVSFNAIISNNQITRYDQANTSTQDGIRLAGNVEGVYIHGNRITSIQAARYAINVSASTVLRTNIGNNYTRHTSGTKTAAINDVGTDTFVDLGDFIIRKTANETVTSSAAPQNDNHLFFPIGYNEIYEVDYTIFYDGSTAGDIRVGLSVAGGATWRIGGMGLGVAAAGDTFDLRSITNTTGTNDFGAAGAGTIVMANFRAVILNVATNTTVFLQWAQGTSDATGTTIYANSYLKARQIR